MTGLNVARHNRQILGAEQTDVLFGPICLRRVSRVPTKLDEDQQFDDPVAGPPVVNVHGGSQFRGCDRLHRLHIDVEAEVPPGQAVDHAQLLGGWPLGHVGRSEQARHNR